MRGIDRLERGPPEPSRFRAAWYRRWPVVWHASSERDCAAWRPAMMRERWSDEPSTLRYFAVDPFAARPRFESLYTRTRRVSFADGLDALAEWTRASAEAPYLRAGGGDGELAGALRGLPFPDRVFGEEGTGSCDWSVHETVLRAGPREYVYPLHCDNLETVLLQLHGRKEIVFVAPDAIASLYLRSDDPTRAGLDDVDHPDPMRFPRFADTPRWRCVLEPGDAVYIPALWFHEVRACGETMSASRTWRRRDHRGFVEAAKPEAWRAWEQGGRRVY